jgi:hypothetical protein
VVTRPRVLVRHPVSLVLGMGLVLPQVRDPVGGRLRHFVIRWSRITSVAGVMVIVGTDSVYPSCVHHPEHVSLAKLKFQSNWTGGKRSGKICVNSYPKEQYA